MVGQLGVMGSELGDEVHQEPDEKCIKHDGVSNNTDNALSLYQYVESAKLQCTSAFSTIYS